MDYLPFAAFSRMDRAQVQVVFFEKRWAGKILCRRWRVECQIGNELRPRLLRGRNLLKLIEIAESHLCVFVKTGKDGLVKKTDALNLACRR